MMKAFHQAPVVGHAFPSCQKPCVSFSSRPYRQSSHQLQLVAAKDTFMYNNKYRRLMVTVSSLSGMPYEKFHESAYDLCKDSSLESLKIVQAAEQKVLPQDMDAQFIESILFDRTLYKYEILGRMASTGLMSVGDEDAIVLALNKIEQGIAQGKFEWVDGQDVHTNVMKALVNIVGEKGKVLTMMNQTDLCLSILTAWYKECIVLITSRIKQIQVALMSLAIRNEGFVLPGAPGSEGNISLHSIVLPIVKEGLSLETSYAVVSLCLKKRCQPGELTPQELQRIGFPCDSLEEIHQARSLLLRKQIVFNSLADRDSLAELLFWFGNLEIDPHVFC